MSTRSDSEETTATTWRLILTALVTGGLNAMTCYRESGGSMKDAGECIELAGCGSYAGG